MAAHQNIRRVGKQRPFQLGHIEKLVLENFKSYEGQHEIGPFDKFTCVIGPNGSGKSNIMDAISFCLGIRARHLRGDRLKDLVYRREEEEIESNTRSAKVTIVFRTSDGDLLQFGRRINTAGQSTYLYGPPEKMRSVGYDDFLNHLADQSIFVKARNFLVFQGDVMELARRQGTNLTGVLETISGSDQLKEEYTRLSRELEVMQEKARMHFQHRREVENAVQLLDRQRAEVVRYNFLRTQREQLAVEMALVRLYNVDREAERSVETDNKLRSELNEVEADLKVKRKLADDAEVERKKAATDSEKATSQHFVLSSNLEQLKPEISNCKKQVSHWMKKLKEAEEQIREFEIRHRSLEAGLKQTRDDRARAEVNIAKLKSKQVESAVQLTEEQRAEYDAAIAKSDALNMRTREKLREVEEQLGIGGRELSSDKRDLNDLEEKNLRSIAKIEDCSNQKGNCEHELEAETAQFEQRKRQVNVIKDEVKKFMLFKDSLIEEHRSLLFQLETARARRERLDLVEARQKVANELRSAFPDGVLGRISELVLPTQKRFDLALQMSMGNMAEAFIVRDAAIGRECVWYLKAKKISTEIFLPLNRMTEPQVGPMHLLTRGHQARRLATACVHHNENFFSRHPHWQAEGPASIIKTLEFLLNGTVIVDSLEEARQISFVDARKHGLSPRVVTLDGEVIAPNGNMSVQSIGSTGRVEFGGVEQLHELKNQEDKLFQVEKDLTTLREECTRKQQQEAELLEQTREIEERHKACELRLHGAKTSHAAEQKTMTGRTARIEEMKAKVEGTTKRLAGLERTKDALQTELLKVGKNYFVKLNKELGVDDMRDIIQKEQREKHMLRQDIEQYEDYIRGLLNEERSIEQRMKGASKLETMMADCEQYKRDIESTNKRQQELEEREKMFEERCEVGRIRLQELSAITERLEQEVRGNRLEVQRLKASNEETKKKLKKHHERVRLLLTFWCGIFRECNERQINIPLLASNDAALELVSSREQDIDDMPFQDIEIACRAIKVDYSPLPQEKIDFATNLRFGDMKTIETEYEAQIVDINKEIETLSPNLRAPEECATEEARLKDIQKQADEASLESQRLSRQFEKVKADRISQFMKCFKHVEANVHPIYRDLTSYDGFDGGSAYLDLDDAEEPYNGGITFTACPPGKRFFPMELLSGGEKSMASMALLFSMHSYQPPPFMILDEVDAPFDRKNTNSLVSYLQKLNFQCLVISLKDTFFSHSDSIVGIYKDKEIQSSGSISLPLRQLGEESEAPETEVPLAEAIYDMD